MAEVHLARELEGEQRVVALKKILPHLGEDTAFMQMFLDEARIAARLHHPNIVEIYDLGIENEALFIAMEFVHGEDLRRIEKRCAELGREFPSRLACRIISEACKGLDYAHQRTDSAGRPLGIVHRDVSPQNLLVSFEGVTKVADFGVAKAADKASVTASGIIKGKHPYMSPEQAVGEEELDRRTDVFALGIVLYEAVTGMRLFRRATDLQTLQAVVDCEVLAPSKVLPGLPAQLDAILLKALAKDRQQRFQTAGELGAALDAYASADAEASVLHAGRFVSELFTERLQRDAKSKRFAPTFGAARGLERVLDVPDARTTDLLMPNGPVPLPPGAVAAPAATRQSRPPGPRASAPQPQTVTAASDRPDEQRTLVSEDQDKTLVPGESSATVLPRVFAIIALMAFAASGWFIASRLDPRKSPSPAGTVVQSGEGSVRLTNESGAKWSGCTLVLPNNTGAKLSLELLPNESQLVTVAPLPVSGPPPPAGQAEVRCESGTHHLQLATQ